MSHSGYFADQEDMRELVRLLQQGHMLTETAGGVLPEQDDLRRFHDILDLACGPGEWVMALSKASPLLHIVGVDLSQRMIAYAQSLIPAARNQDVQFQVADLSQGQLAFPDESFDLINARLLLGFMKQERWPALLSECFRLLRPGGIIRTTEYLNITSNDPIIQRSDWVALEAWRRAGRAWTSGPQTTGFEERMPALLGAAGFVEISSRGFGVNFGTGSPYHEFLLENFAEAHRLSSRFLTQQNLGSEREIEELAHDLLALKNKPSLTASWNFLCLTGKNPERKNAVER
jgi:SAM-dependent methyltransferase